MSDVVADGPHPAHARVGQHHRRRAHGGASTSWPTSSAASRRSRRRSSPSTADSAEPSRRGSRPMTAAATPDRRCRRRRCGRAWPACGSIFGKTIRDSRRAICWSSLLLGLVFIGVSQAIAAEFDTPESRQQMVDLVNAVPPILQGLAGPIVNVEHAGRLPRTTSTGRSSRSIVSLWSILALSGTLAAEARRGSLEFVAAAPITRRRIALEKLSGTSPRWPVIAIPGHVRRRSRSPAARSPVLPGDEISVTQPRSATRSGSVLMALAGGSRGVRARPVRRPRRGGRHRRLRHLRRLPPQRLPGAGARARAVRQPDLVRLDVDHLPLAGQFDWPSLRPRGGRSTSSCSSIGVEAFVAARHRRDQRGPDAVAAARPGRAARSARPDRSASNLPARSPGASGSACSGWSSPARASASSTSCRTRPRLHATAQHRSSRASTSRTVGGFLQLLFVEFGHRAGRAGRGDARSRLGVGGDVRPPRDACSPLPLSRLRWALSGGAGMFIDMRW